MTKVGALAEITSHTPSGSRKVEQRRRRRNREGQYNVIQVMEEELPKEEYGAEISHIT